MNLYKVKLPSFNKVVMCIRAVNEHFKLYDKVIVLYNKIYILGEIVEILNGNKEANLSKIKGYYTYKHKAIEHKILKKEEAIRIYLNNYSKTNSYRMKVVKIIVSYDLRGAVICYDSVERIDFRNILKCLIQEFHIPFMFRQVGLRDAVKFLGGLGPCGMPTCCSTFKKTFNSIKFSMATLQNYAITPSKLTGICGKLLCCLSYEYDSYLENSKYLPKVGNLIATADGICVVKDVDILSKKINVYFEQDNSFKKYDLNLVEFEIIDDEKSR